VLFQKGNPGYRTRDQPPVTRLSGGVLIRPSLHGVLRGPPYATKPLPDSRLSTVTTVV
jgi:hypothetical protein